MANQNNISQALQEFYRLLSSGQHINTAADPGLPAFTNKGPAPGDSKAIMDILANYQPSAQQKPVSSQYDPKRPGSSMLGINYDNLDQAKPQNPIYTTKPGSWQDGANFLEQPISIQTLPARFPVMTKPQAPAIPRAPKGETVRLSPGMYRDDKGALVRSSGKPLKRSR